MTVRDYARRVMGHFRVPVPQRDRTLWVELPPRAVPDFGIRCLCHVVAKRYWRVAHEHRCTRLGVRRSATHVHLFDTVDLMRAHVRWLRWWPGRPETIHGRVPRLLATRTAEAAGDRLDFTRPMFHVPVAVSGSMPAARG